MTARRTLFTLFAGIALGPMPACLHISGTATTGEPVEVKAPSAGEFASFPKRPGEVIRKHPETMATASKPSEPVEPSELIVALPPVSDSNIVKVSVPMLPPVGILAATEPELLAALQAYLENRPDDAIRLLQSLDRPNQDFALALMPLLVRGSQMKMASANPEEVAVLVEQLHAIAGRLESKAALKVEKVTFYRKLDGFGRYNPWPEGQPYRPNDLANIYFEVRNVSSEPAPGPNGETYLIRAIVTLEVRDATGKLVEQTDPTNFRRRVPVARYEYADHSHSPLHDYSRCYRMSVPTQPGVYTVTVEVKDPSSQRVARSQPVRFDVAGP